MEWYAKLAKVLFPTYEDSVPTKEYITFCCMNCNGTFDKNKAKHLGGVISNTPRVRVCLNCWKEWFRKVN